MCLLVIDCRPFSVLVRLIAYEASGGCKDYRNSDALKKAEVNVSSCGPVGVLMQSCRSF